MGVYRLFRNRAFEPETITVMTGVYAEVCRALALNDGNQREVVAKTVIEFTQRGVRDRSGLRESVLQALRSNRSGPQGPAARQPGL